MCGGSRLRMRGSAGTILLLHLGALRGFAGEAFALEDGAQYGKTIGGVGVTFYADVERGEALIDPHIFGGAQQHGFQRRDGARHGVVGLVELGIGERGLDGFLDLREILLGNAGLVIGKLKP